VLPTALRVVEARRQRLSTGEVNDLLRDAYDAISPPSKGGRPLRIYYGTQVSSDPPTLVIFVNDVDIVHFSYERYLDNRIRAVYPFEGTPLKLIFRARQGEE
jgi:GTP-binding protein